MSFFLSIHPSILLSAQNNSLPWFLVFDSKCAQLLLCFGVVLIFIQDGLMDEWMDEWVDGWMNGWMNEWTDGWMDGWVDGWMGVWIGIDGGVEGWMNGWMDWRSKPVKKTRLLKNSCPSAPSDSHCVDVINFNTNYLNTHRSQHPSINKHVLSARWIAPSIAHSSRRLSIPNYRYRS